jgi:hypothetical protein
MVRGFGRQLNGNRQMRYVLEILDIDGNGIGEEQEDRIETDSSFPMPHVGDVIHLRQSPVEVVRREFYFHPEANGLEIQVSLYCKPR